MRTSKLRSRSLTLVAGGLVACVMFAGPAGAGTLDGAEAQAPPPATGDVPESGTSTITPEGQALGLAVKVELDTQPRPEGALGKNGVPLIVTITENGVPTTRDYDVFANARNAAGNVMETQACLERWYTSTTTPRGIFWCTVIVDRPDTWTHSAFVNKRKVGGEFGEGGGAGGDEVPVNYGQAHAAIPCLESDGCKRLLSVDNPRSAVKGDAADVAFLSIHTIFASGWFLCIGLLVLLSLAAGRRLLSARGTHMLESKLDRIVTGAKATTLAVAATGIYLMFRATAYNTPSTPDKLDAVFKLPYGRPYYMSLFIKITLYAVLVGFSFVIIKEARRRSTTVLEGGRRRVGREVSSDDIWGANWEEKPPTPVSTSGSGTTAVMVDEPRVIVEEEADEAAGVVEATRKGTRVAILVTAAGVVGIWFCVVLLKYFHQLIEAAFAAG